ncbi:MAG: phosphoribosylamine--glycine ligase [Actinomycetaceae bacterium]|nr:phosphoribosylamine--glycine ligase [Actinomycetaceae bacterium]
MNILLLGSGGREHAIARALRRDSVVNELFIAPGNPGMESLGTCVSLDITSGGDVASFAKEHDITLVIPGPEAPLVAGVADAVREVGIAVFGPGKEAARLEGSKAFAKEVMNLADVPTAQAYVCESEDEVKKAFADFGAPYVVKDDGLAAGKGVVVTSEEEEALAHARACLAKENGRVVIEEYLDGPELSLFCICDGVNVVPLEPAQDFKRAYDDDKGLNTGGMGAYSPLPWIPEGLVEEVVETVARPVVDEMARRGAPFIGLLYCGLALTSRGVRVIEFNVRFGDPETQSVLARLKTPLASLLYSAATGALSPQKLEWDNNAAVTVVLASEGYPVSSRSGDEITGITEAEEVLDAHVIQAGTTTKDGVLVSSGGRVLATVGLGHSVAAARSTAYEALSKIHLEGSHYRSDIAKNI